MKDKGQYPGNSRFIISSLLLFYKTLSDQSPEELNNGQSDTTVLIMWRHWGPTVQLKRLFFKFKSTHILCGCSQPPKSQSGNTMLPTWSHPPASRGFGAVAAAAAGGEEGWRARCDWALIYIFSLAWRTTGTEDLSSGSWTGEEGGAEVGEGWRVPVEPSRQKGQFGGKTGRGGRGEVRAWEWSEAKSLTGEEETEQREGVSPKSRPVCKCGRRGYPEASSALMSPQRSN